MGSCVGLYNGHALSVGAQDIFEGADLGSFWPYRSLGSAPSSVRRRLSPIVLGWTKRVL